MTGWPDPSRPGVPANPERTASHWVTDVSSDEVVVDWNAEVSRWGSWPFTTPEAMAEDNDYLGPCLTPAEVAAREAAARREGIEASLRAAFSAACEAQAAGEPPYQKASAAIRALLNETKENTNE